MTGLPAIPSTRRRRAVWEIFVLGGIERLTEHLMHGNEVPEEDLEDLMAVNKRLHGLNNAVEARLRAVGRVIEDDE